MRRAPATGVLFCLFAAPVAAQDAGVFGGALPELAIRASEATGEWPFSVEEGSLTCMAYQGQRVVIFSEPWRDDVPQEFGDMTLPRSVIVSTNPLALMASLEDRDLYRPFDGLETLIRRLAPYEAIGLALCDGEAAQGRDRGGAT